MEYDDLYQIGAIGLCKAASRYKQSKQAAFSTYAFHVIKNTIIDYLRGLNTRLRVQSCFLEESERYIKQQYMTDLAGQLYKEMEEVKKSVSDRNTKIATAITEKGVATEPTDSADVMAENIRKIPTGTSNSQILSTTMISGLVQCRVTHEIDNTLD